MIRAKKINMSRTTIPAPIYRMLLLIPANRSSFSAMLTDIDWLVVFPSTIVWTLKDCIPDFVGISLIITSADSSSPIEVVCGVTLITFAQASVPVVEITKSLAGPLFVIVVLIVNSSPTFAIDSKSAVIDGAGDLQESMFTLKLYVSSKSFSEFSS